MRDDEMKLSPVDLLDLALALFDVLNVPLPVCRRESLRALFPENLGVARNLWKMAKKTRNTIIIIVGRAQPVENDRQIRVRICQKTVKVARKPWKTTEKHGA